MRELTIDEKIKFIDMINNGASNHDVSSEFKINHSGVSILRQNFYQIQLEIKEAGIKSREYLEGKKGPNNWDDDIPNKQKLLDKALNPSKETESFEDVSKAQREYQAKTEGRKLKTTKDTKVVNKKKVKKVKKVAKKTKKTKKKVKKAKQNAR